MFKFFEQKLQGSFMISIEALQAIDSIDRKGSFSAAAEELFRVPSAITYTIKKLEEQLNIKLFDRSKQRAVLTPAGKLILERGRAILGQIQRLEDQAKQAHTGWEKRLRIVIDTILPCEPFWPLIRELQDEQPWLEIQVIDHTLGGTWEALVHDRADLIVGASGEEPAGGHWHSEYLGHLEMQLCCSPEHPAAQITDQNEKKSLKNYTHIMISDSARYLPQRNIALMDSHRVLAVSNLQQKVSALKAGVGVSHLPLYLSQDLIKSGELVTINHDDTLMPIPFFMCCRKDNAGKANQWLRRHIIARRILAGIVQSSG